MSTQTPRREIIQTKAAIAARDKRRNVIIIALISVLALATIVAISYFNRAPESASTAPINATIKVGDKAPDFALATTGGPFQLSKDGAQRPTLLEVFATWCPHCQREAPLLSTLFAKYKGRVNFVGVNGAAQGEDGQSAETQQDVIAWAQKYKATYPVAFDPNLDVAKEYLEGGFPTIVIVGTDGKVSALRAGEIPPANITKALDAVLAGQKPDPGFGLKN